jgi:hypothetical protein
MIVGLPLLLLLWLWLNVVASTDSECSIVYLSPPPWRWQPTFEFGRSLETKHPRRRSKKLQYIPGLQRHTRDPFPTDRFGSPTAGACVYDSPSSRDSTVAQPGCTCLVEGDASVLPRRTLVLQQCAPDRAAGGGHNGTIQHTCWAIWFSCPDFSKTPYSRMGGPWLGGFLMEVGLG